MNFKSQNRKNKFNEDLNFKHVSYLWDEKKAAELANDEVGLLVYGSNLLGADLRLINYGGVMRPAKRRRKIH